MKKHILFAPFPKHPITRQCAFTFDDGPHCANTGRILHLLEKKAARGTFFSTGKNILAHASIAAEVSSRGHLLANHTYTHVNPLFTGKRKLRDELLRAKDIIEDITGKPNRYFRPPYGIVTPALLSICRALELSIVLWNANSYDFRREHGDRIIKRVERKIRPGAIVLFHECHYNDETLDYSNTLLALDAALGIAAERGLTGVTIQEMALPGFSMQSNGDEP